MGYDYIKENIHKWDNPAFYIDLSQSNSEHSRHHFLMEISIKRKLKSHIISLS